MNNRSERYIAKMKKAKVILKRWQNEMAEILYKKESLFLGNDWDFHPGCYGADLGTVEHGTISLDFKGVWTDGTKGPNNVAEMIAKRIGTTVEVKVLNTRWNG